MIGPLRGDAARLLERVADVDGNRLLDSDGHWYVFLKLRNVSWDLLPETTKLEYHRRYKQSLMAMAGRRVKVLSYAKDFDADRYIGENKALAPGSAAWHDWNDFAADHVSARSPFERQVYVSVPLDDVGFAAGFLDDLTRWAENGARAIKGEDRLSRHLGPGLSYTPLERREAKDKAAEVAQAFDHMLAPEAEQPDEATVARLLLRMGTYGLGEPEDLGVVDPGELDGWRPRVTRLGSVAPGAEDTRPYVPDWSENRHLFGGAVWQESLKDLRFLWEGGRESYGRFFAVKGMPQEGLRFPDGEFGIIPFAANMLQDMEIVAPEAAERERREGAMRLSEQIKHVAQSGARLPLKLVNAGRDHDRIEQQLARHEPIVKMRTLIWVFAPSQEALEVRSRAVKKYFSRAFSISLVPARANQKDALADFFPCGKPEITDYAKPMSPDTAAGSMPFGNTSVGDGGPFLGFTRSTRAPVGFLPEAPMKRAKDAKKSGTTVWIGEQGAGKSVGCYHVICTHALRGVPALVMDSKGDARNIKDIPELAGAVEEIVVAEGTATRLPILRMYPVEHSDKTAGLYKDFLVEVMGARHDEVLREVIRWAADHHVDRWADSGGRRKSSQLRDSFREAAKFMGDSDYQTRAKLAADRIDRLMHPRSLASIALADDAEDGEVLSAEAGPETGPANFAAIASGLVTVILTNDLALPHYGQTDVSETELIGSGLNLVVAAAAKRLIAVGRMTQTAKVRQLVFEEAWRQLDNSYGRQLVRSADRESRSLNYVSHILTQQGRDLGNLLQLATRRFIGRNTNEADASMLLRSVGVDPDPALLAYVAGQSDGQFVYRDHLRRAALMNVEVCPSYWLPILNTDPDQAGSDGGPDGGPEGGATRARVGSRERQVA